MKETLNIFSTEIQESHISNIYTKNYHALHTDYLELQRDWLHRAYSQFQDLDKYFILISLVNKTMNAYSDYMLSYTWDEYYKPKEVELKKFSIVDIAKELDISKETARRKILELEKAGVLKKNKKSLTIQRDGFEFQKPSNSIKHISRLLSSFSKKLLENKIIKNHISTDDFISLIKTNYTQCWRYFLNFQIEFMTEFKKVFFKDYETFSIWATIVYNQNLHFNNKIKGDKNYTKFLDSITDEGTRFSKDLLSLSGSFGLNAMTISDLTGVPRPTVIRKLRRLESEKFIIKNDLNLYSIHSGQKVSVEVEKMRFKNMQRISNMICKLLNTARLNLKKS